MSEIEAKDTSSEDIDSTDSQQNSVEGSGQEQITDDASVEPKKDYYRPPYSRYTNSR